MGALRACTNVLADGVVRYHGEPIAIVAAESEDAALAETSLRLAEAIRLLATKHGQPALEHCLALVERVQVLLDQATGIP